MATKQPEPREDEDEFLAFWRERRAKQKRPTQRILGVDVEVPSDLPLAFEDKAKELQAAGSKAAFAELLETLFGANVYEQWKAQGLNGPQLQVLVAWGMANGSGKPVTFAEAAELVDKAEALQAEKDAAGKATAPNRAARRASSKTAASAGTGRSSKRTSRASTA